MSQEIYDVQIVEGLQDINPKKLNVAYGKNEESTSFVIPHPA